MNHGGFENGLINSDVWLGSNLLCVLLSLILFGLLSKRRIARAYSDHGILLKHIIKQTKVEKEHSRVKMPKIIQKKNQESAMQEVMCTKDNFTHF